MRLAVLGLLACAGGSAWAQRAPDYAALDRAIAAGEAPKTTSVLVMRGGTIQHEVYAEGATVDTLHDTRSVGKSITALSILRHEHDARDVVQDVWVIVWKKLSAFRGDAKFTTWLAVPSRWRYSAWLPWGATGLPAE